MNRIAPQPHRAGTGSGPDKLLGQFAHVRARSEALAAPLSPEDQCLQSMPDASPTKWHLAHTTWFFETFVLGAFIDDYEPVHPDYGYLFNSYYEAVGARHPRPIRGLLSRPSHDEVMSYRHTVTARVMEFAADATDEQWSKAASVIELGCHHEQQHQELLLMDILHALSKNATDPAYQNVSVPNKPAVPLEFIPIDGGLQDIGHPTHDQDASFAFDNEGPRHQFFVAPFKLANRCVTNGEFLKFMEDDGYRRADLWLADGWAQLQSEHWSHPIYWREEANGHWTHFSLNGRVDLDPDAPACHISHYEADAYARWAGKRLPTEQEWEVASQAVPRTGQFAENGLFAPLAPDARAGLLQMFGDVWEHTASAYSAYPGFKICDGAIGEYNGKFMINQWVLRGGACVTPGDHIRPTYRNFFYPHQRWMFAGLRLAEDA